MMAHVFVLESTEDVYQDVSKSCNVSANVPVQLSSLQELAASYVDMESALVVFNKQEGVSLYDFYKVIDNLGSHPKVIVISNTPNVEEMKYALRRGAIDYIDRQVAQERLDEILSRLHVFGPDIETNEAFFKDIERKYNIIGKCQKIRNCVQLLMKASQSDASVLIYGETGTGKELFARAIHGMSRRKNKNLVVVDCASLHASLAESILFGHAKGSFTGAESNNAGLIVRANGGTLFLDEVSELSLELQKKFLRVLQERKFLPVGDGREVSSDFRLVAACNKDLRQLVSDGLFRSDLLYRIQSVKLELPPLRQRIDDLPYLVDFLIKKSCDKNMCTLKKCSKEFVETLARHDWPGNVRELENVIDSVVAISHDQPIVYPELLPSYIRIKSAMQSFPQYKASESPGKFPMAIKEFEEFPTYKQFRNKMLELVDKRYFNDLYRVSDGKLAEAMRLANLSRARLYAFYKKHNIMKNVS